MRSPVSINMKKGCWFTSDLHLGHKRIMEFDDTPHRKFKSTEEMDAHIIETWNNYIDPDDTAFHLGDLSFRSYKDTLVLLNQMNGKKVFINGNHDDHLRKGPALSVAKGFLLQADYLYQKIGDDKVFLLHFPMFNWRDQRHGTYHLHGHKHGNPTGIPGRIKDVGWDVLGRPIHWSEIKSELDSKETINHHEETCTTT